MLPEGRPSRAAVRISGDWYAPVGGIALVACGAFSLFGFPLDDVWHRLFGQDVTLWGPTHMMLIGGAGLALIGQTMLMVEGRSQAPSGRHARGFLGLLARTRYAAVMGGFLVGLSAFQAEFDFGVPQFRLLFQPVLIAAAAGIALVAARVYGGRGAALAAAAYFIVIRGIVGLLVGPVLGETTPHMPLYLVEAAAIEALALAVSPTRAYRFGALSGLLIGTVGFAAEYGWSHVWMPHPWPAALIGEALVAVLVTAVAAGVLGAFIGSALGANRAGALVRLPRVAPAALALAAIVGVFAYGLDTKPVDGVRASVALREVSPAPDRTVEATVRIDPPSAARDADWLTAMAWQGGGLKINRLRQVAPGVWRTTAPLPVHGDWKTLVRLHRDRSIVALPIYLPKDDCDSRTRRCRPRRASSGRSCSSRASCSGNRRATCRPRSRPSPTARSARSCWRSSACWDGRSRDWARPAPPMPARRDSLGARRAASSRQGARRDRAAPRPRRPHARDRAVLRAAAAADARPARTDDSRAGPSPDRHGGNLS